MTLYSDNLEMTDTLREIAEELGPDEIARRAAALSDYASTVIVAAYSPDLVMTPALMVKWAQFADAACKTARIDGHEIKRQMTHEERVVTVLKNEHSERQMAKWRAEREAKEAKEAEEAEAKRQKAENGGEDADEGTLKGITL